jgi:hypothetical protein
MNDIYPTFASSNLPFQQVPRGINILSIWVFANSVCNVNSIPTFVINSDSRTNHVCIIYGQTFFENWY